MEQPKVHNYRLNQETIQRYGIPVAQVFEIQAPSEEWRKAHAPNTRLADVLYILIRKDTSLPLDSRSLPIGVRPGEFVRFY